MHNEDRIHFFECSCHSDEHTLKFQCDKENKEIYICIYLGQPNNIFKRVWLAMKYIFGYKSKYGDFDCFLFKQKDIPILKELIKEIE